MMSAWIEIKTWRMELRPALQDCQRGRRVSERERRAQEDREERTSVLSPCHVFSSDRQTLPVNE